MSRTSRCYTERMMTVYDERSARKDLVFYGRKIEEKNLTVGPGGNTSARAGDVVYIKASGAAFEDATAKSLTYRLLCGPGRA